MVKTRLIPRLGQKGAAALAAAFLQDSWSALQKLSHVHPLVASTDLHSGLGLNPPAEIWLQGPGDLGARMEHVLRRALNEAPFAIAVGADSPGIPTEYLQQAINALHSGCQAVLGPSEDGGFYLIGLSRCPEGLFNELPWSEATTGQATLKRLQQHGFEVQQTCEWWDVDQPADVDRLRALLDDQPQAAPQSRILLEKLLS